MVGGGPEPTGGWGVSAEGGPRGGNAGDNDGGGRCGVSNCCPDKDWVAPPPSNDGSFPPVGTVSEN